MPASSFPRLIGLFFAVILIGKLGAQTSFDEAFDYLPGADLLGQGGGSGFAGPWIASGFNATIHDNYDIGAGSLVHGEMVPSGNRVVTGATNAIAGLGRELAVPIFAGAAETVYMSLVLRPEGILGQGQFSGFFGAYLDGTGDADVFVGKPGGGALGRYVIENRGGSNQVATGLAPVVGETALLVLRVDLRPGPDGFTFYANPDPCAPEPSSGVIKNDVDLGDLTAVVLYSTGAFSLDELRMGPSFESVVRAICPFREPMEYTPGALLAGQDGGTGFSGPWFPSGFNATIHDSQRIAAASLTHEDLAVTGNRAQSAATNAIAGLGRNLAVPISADAVATVYFSLLLRPEGVLGQGQFGGFFGAYLDGTGDADLFVGKPGAGATGSYVIENRGGAGQVASAAPAVVGEAAFLVVRADLRPGPDVFTLYTNPHPCQPEPGTGVVKTGLDLGEISALVIYSTGAFSIDELRLGTSFEEVTECVVIDGGDQIPSDCNQDGSLDISDGVCLLGFLFLGTLDRLPCGNGGPAEPGNVALLDANGDGQIDISDATRVFGYLFLGQAPPVLGRTCQFMPGCPTGPSCGG